MTFIWSKKSVIALIIIVLLLIAAYFFLFSRFISPVKDEVNLVTEQVEIQERIIENAGLSDTETETSESGQSTTLQKKVSIDKNMKQIIDSFQMIEKNSNVVIQQLRAEESPETAFELELLEPIESLPIELQVSSSNRNNLSTFLEELTKEERIMHIKRIEETVTEENEWQLSIQLDAFYNPNLTLLEAEAPQME